MMGLNLQLNPAQSVTPQMIASMTMLQYSTQELSEYLSDLSYENPMVELVEPEAPAVPDAAAERLRWLQAADRQNRSYYREDEGRDCAAPSPEGSLAYHLEEQLLSMELSAGVARGAKIIIALLDAHGFFDGDLSEAARLAHISRADAEQALALIQTLEPWGVGSKNVRECLLAQLTRDNSGSPLAVRLITDYYEQLGTCSPRQLARRLHVTGEAVQAAIQEIAALSPYPGDGYVSEETVVYLRPDVYILPGPDGLIVRGAESQIPTVTISRTYLNMLKTTDDPEAKAYLRKKLAQAEQVMRDIQNRSSTMLRCAEIIAVRQAEVFRGGVLKKLTLRDVAEEMGVHESTVSRTVRNKYVECPLGLVPMSRFFSRGAGQNGSFGRDSVKAMLKELIAAENPASPLSDERLAERLAARHISVSRRTIAKYRAELGIPSAFVRKLDN